ncbi:anti-anti-sigma factor [Legionella beliardensis]|uniref:Anti-anti-sigma factor n=1 Tax=Legionella beliardensis TaxID=91822 RepID=A0A378I1P9_9GAMM|nr:STAS domain-containing protein [Legionella beliardensis]STX28640.1 anti-anti-sigma factor [Legionella beliardensis]
MNSSSFIPAEHLLFTTVEAERKRLLDYCCSSTGKLLTIDLNKVSQCDSAGLAFLIEFKRLARIYNKQGKIKGITNAIFALAEFCGVDQILVEEHQE